MRDSSESWSYRDAVLPGVEALRRYWPPFLLIQLAAAGLVVAYYQSSSVRNFADQIGTLKTTFGLLFSAVGGFLAGGVLPELAKLLTGRLLEANRKWLAQTAFNGFVYLIVAVQVDLFYRMQAVWFGNGIDAGTVALKTLVDMGLFAPLLCMPTAVLICELRAAQWRLARLLSDLKNQWYRHKVLPALIPGWGFWIPFLLALYALPVPLQLPFALLGEAAWSLLFIFIATSPVAESEDAVCPAET